MSKYILYSAKGSGGTICEVVLAMSKLPHSVELIEWEDLRKDDYKKINPIQQVPALKLPTGEIMTESLAICQLINERAGLNLVPDKDHPQRANYLRWSTYLVASIYPTFTFGDDPSRFVSGEAKNELRNSSDRFREKMWGEFEKATKSPWFLGETQSLIDIYFSLMMFWRPGKDWFAQNAPKITAIAKKVQATEACKAVFKNNGL